MTPKERAAMQQALECLNTLISHHTVCYSAISESGAVDAEYALREALAEPVRKCDGLLCNDCGEYKQKYKDLTDDEVCRVYQGIWPFHPAEEPKLADDIARFARAVIAAYKEKNK